MKCRDTGSLSLGLVKTTTTAFAMPALIVTDNRSLLESEMAALCLPHHGH